jgi:hypothetical protein
MNISQGLKEKNRAVGRINELKLKIRKNNMFLSGSQKDYNSRDLLLILQEEWAYLIALKTKIAVANLGIVDKLVKLAEAKAELDFWDDMESYSGPKENVSTRSERRGGGEYVSVEETTFSTITSLEVSEEKNRVQKLIEQIQDEIDNFNATTQI